MLLTEENALDSRTKNIIQVENNSQAFNTQRTSHFHNNRGGSRMSYRGRAKTRFSNFNSGSSSTSTYGVSKPPPYYQQSQSYNSGNDRPTCQISQMIGHLAIDCNHRLNFSYIGRTPPAKLQAYMVNRENSASTSQPTWILDTRATNHVTSDFNNLSISFEYNGTDRLSMGNGEELSIQNTCASLLKTPTNHFFS